MPGTLIYDFITSDISDRFTSLRIRCIGCEMEEVVFDLRTWLGISKIVTLRKGVLDLVEIQ